MIKQGSLRGEKILYPDGLGCCIWYPIDPDDDDSIGLAFDFDYDDIDDLIALLNRLKAIEPEVYEEVET